MIDYAKPYSFGHLNDEVVVLLQSLGVTEATLLRKQREHLQFLVDAVNDPRTAFRFLCYINKLELAERILIDGIEACRPELQGLTNNEKNKMLNKREEQRCRIFIFSYRSQGCSLESVIRGTC